jgi:hypothetical protein
MEVDDNDKAKIDSLLMEFRAVLLKKIESYASLIRTDNHDSATKVKGEIENLRDDFLQKLPDSLKKKELIDAINVYMSQVIFELTELAKNNEMILKERIGTEVFADDDKDGVSNYDEINLYKTNAFSADTDGDGFIDGAEITRGFDPHNSKKQANIAYESPKETGLVREDLLVVEKILSLSQSDDEEVKSQSQALISGRGLPNSFVTLYIFSTPIVVTVKTDEKGNWSYIFDKELEDGRHEIVAGITDNAGKIVAKSNPITFVKTAEAFEMQNTADQIATNVTAPTLTKSSTTLLVSSLLVIILGFVLIFLGMHVKKHQITQDKMTL